MPGPRCDLDGHGALLEVALAHLAVADDFPDWLLTQTGTVDPDLALEI